MAEKQDNDVVKLHMQQDCSASAADGKPLIILTGPTAVGKSDLAVRLAERIDGEIISADSMQVYRGMDIGSAKITKAEMRGIPHHLIDVLEPGEAFDVARFQQLAVSAMEQIYQRNRIPIIAGGTGFYIQSVLYDIHFSETDETDTETAQHRKTMELQAASEEGRMQLYQQLQDIDPESAAALHPNNSKRVIRALEYYRQTGGKMSVHNEEQRKKLSPYNFVYFVLTDDRAAIYERINTRVDQMAANGLVQEVQTLRDKGYDRSFVSMQGLGYKEILAFLEGECTLEEALYIIKRDTRHFAKRQLTWFRREPDVVWIDRREYTSAEAMLDRMQQELRSRGIYIRESDHYDTAE